MSALEDLEDITLIKSIPAFLDGLGPTDCKARKEGGLRCCLDAIHIEINTKHLHRHSDGRLESFSVEVAQRKRGDV